MNNICTKCNNEIQHEMQNEQQREMQNEQQHEMQNEQQHEMQNEQQREMQNEQMQNQQQREMQNEQIQNEQQQDEMQNEQIQNEQQQDEMQNEKESRRDKNTNINLVLSCMDYGIVNKTMEFLKENNFLDNFYYTILPGASLGYNQDYYECWTKTFNDQLILAIKMSKINEIIIIDHDDCITYKLFYKDLKKHPKREKRYHCLNIMKSIELLKLEYPFLAFSGYLLHLDGSATKVV